MSSSTSIESMPSEILAYIFQLVEPSCKNLANLGLVCTIFKRITTDDLYIRQLLWRGASVRNSGSLRSYLPYEEREINWIISNWEKGNCIRGRKDRLERPSELEKPHRGITRNYYISHPYYLFGQFSESEYAYGHCNEASFISAVVNDGVQDQVIISYMQDKELIEYQTEHTYPITTLMATDSFLIARSYDSVRLYPFNKLRLITNTEDKLIGKKIFGDNDEKKLVLINQRHLLMVGSQIGRYFDLAYLGAPNFPIMIGLGETIFKSLENPEKCFIDIDGNTLSALSRDHKGDISLSVWELKEGTLIYKETWLPEEDILKSSAQLSQESLLNSLIQIHNSVLIVYSAPDKRLRVLNLKTKKYVVNIKYHQYPESIIVKGEKIIVVFEKDEFHYYFADPELIPKIAKDIISQTPNSPGKARLLPPAAVAIQDKPVNTRASRN